MLGHIRILFKATGGKFEQPSDKRQRNMRKMAINRLLERILFLYLTQDEDASINKFTLKFVFCDFYNYYGI